MIINSDGGYGLLAAYIGGPVAQANSICLFILKFIMYADACIMQELVVDRWVSKKERENTEHLVIP